MNNTIHTEEYKGYTINIVHDDEPLSPRTEWDNMGKMVCFHKQYTLGDKHNYNEDDFTSWNELEDSIKKNEDAVIILPLYLYDHSGLRMKIGSFQGLLAQGHAEFDSGVVGFIYVTRQAVLENYQVKRITKAVKEKAQKVLEGEVETYDDYLSGSVYGYEVEEINASSWGYYGDYKYAIEDAESQIDDDIAEKAKEREAKTKQLIQAHVPLIYRK